MCRTGSREGPRGAGRTQAGTISTAKGYPSSRLCVAVEKGLPGRVDSEPDAESEAQAVLRLRLVRSVLRRGTRGHEPFFRLYLELALSFAPGPGKRPRPEKPFRLAYFDARPRSRPHSRL